MISHALHFHCTCNLPQCFSFLATVIQPTRACSPLPHTHAVRTQAHTCTRVMARPDSCYGSTRGQARSRAAAQSGVDRKACSDIRVRAQWHHQRCPPVLDAQEGYRLCSLSACGEVARGGTLAGGSRGFRWILFVFDLLGVSCNTRGTLCRTC